MRSYTTYEFEYSAQTDIRPFLCDKCLAKCEAIWNRGSVVLPSPSKGPQSLDELLCDRCLAKLKRN
jgi:hypothetical protein